ncbi:MAG: hypothetical protein ACTHOF_02510 [Flavisolibacter sp.]|jgi:hypothetical protein
MKTIVCLLAGVLLTSFTGKEVNRVDGIWTGVYKTDNSREKVLVRFEDQSHIELYNGDVIESNKFTGTYELQGDSVLQFSYQTADGKEFTMKGHINKRKNYVDGVWQTSGNLSGSFYLKKERIQELFIQP